MDAKRIPLSGVPGYTIIKQKLSEHEHELANYSLNLAGGDVERACQMISLDTSLSDESKERICKRLKQVFL